MRKLSTISILVLLISIVLINSLIRCDENDKNIENKENQEPIIDVLKSSNNDIEKPILKTSTDNKNKGNLNIKKSIKNKIKYQVDISEGIISDTEDKENDVNKLDTQEEEEIQILTAPSTTTTTGNKKYFKKPKNENDYEKVSMVNHEGTKFDCYIPKPKATETEEWFDLPTVDEISEFFEILDETCINKNMGWWTYQFCFNKYLRQFHMDKGDHIAAEFYLGKIPYKNNKGEIKGIDKEFIEAYNRKEILELPEGQVPYYMEVYTDGTPCDILNTKRQTEIKYFCSTDQSKSHYIQEIVEPSSCTYILKIYTPFICALHPLFIPKADTLLNIQCVSQ